MKHIQLITDKFAESIGLEVNEVKIRDMKRRWGSATAQRLTFNWKIIMAPTRLVECVVAHEMCHLVYVIILVVSGGYWKGPCLTINAEGLNLLSLASSST